MGGIIFHHAKGCWLAIGGVNSGHFISSFSGSLNTENIPGGGNHQSGFWSPHKQQVRMVQSFSNAVKKILLSILWTIGLKQSGKVGDVIFGRRGIDPLV